VRQTFHELEKIPFPSIELMDAFGLGRLATSKSYQRCVEHFAVGTGEQLLLFTELQAFLFSLIRTLKPEQVFEIGPHHRAITAAMCRALALNGIGLLHVLLTDEQDGARNVFNDFSTELRSRTRCYSADVVGFFAEMRDKVITPALVVVNDSQLFDSFVILECATSIIGSGGLILIRNGRHAEVSDAVGDFLLQHPEWRSNASVEAAGPKHSAAVARVPPLVGVEYAILFAPSRIPAIARG